MIHLGNLYARDLFIKILRDISQFRSLILLNSIAVASCSSEAAEIFSAFPLYPSVTVDISPMNLLTSLTLVPIFPAIV